MNKLIKLATYYTAAAISLGLIQSCNTNTPKFKENLEVHRINYEIPKRRDYSDVAAEKILHQIKNITLEELIPERIKSNEYNSNTLTGIGLNYMYSINKELFDQVKANEEKHLFRKEINEYLSLLSNIARYKNILLIQALEEDSVYFQETGITKKFNKKLHAEYVPLKKLMEDLEKIKNNNTPDLQDLQKLIALYNRIGKTIKSGTSGTFTKNAEGLPYLTTGNRGDCNDLTSAYYSLLKHYLDIPIKMVFAKDYFEPEKYILHTWLEIDLHGTRFDLDPAYYDVFIPLKPRLKE